MGVGTHNETLTLSRSGKLLHKYMYEPIKCRTVGEHRMKGINEKSKKKKGEKKEGREEQEKSMKRENLTKYHEINRPVGVKMPMTMCLKTKTPWCNIIGSCFCLILRPTYTLHVQNHRSSPHRARASRGACIWITSTSLDSKIHYGFGILQDP